MAGIALLVIADLVTDLIETLLEKAEVILVAQLGNRFVGIEEIVVTVLLWRNIGHQHICSCQNRLFSSPGFDRLQCGGGGGGEPFGPGEVVEEVGIELSAADLVPFGYERFRHLSGPLLRPPGQDVLQAFTATISQTRPPLSAQASDTSQRRWVTPEEYEALCGGEFWWPLAARLRA